MRTIIRAFTYGAAGTAGGMVTVVVAFGAVAWLAHRAIRTELAQTMERIRTAQPYRQGAGRYDREPTDILP